MAPGRHADGQEQDGGKGQMGEQRHGGAGRGDKTAAYRIAAGEKSNPEKRSRHFI